MYTYERLLLCSKAKYTWRPRTLLLSLSLIEAFSPELSPADDAFNFSEFIICWSLGPGTPNRDGPSKIKWNTVLQELEQCKCWKKTFNKRKFFFLWTFYLLHPQRNNREVLEKHFYNHVSYMQSFRNQHCLWLHGCYRNLYLQILLEMLQMCLDEYPKYIMINETSMIY